MSYALIIFEMLSSTFSTTVCGQNGELHNSVILWPFLKAMKAYFEEFDYMDVSYLHLIFYMAIHALFRHYNRWIIGFFLFFLSFFLSFQMEVV